MPTLAVSALLFILPLLAPSPVPVTKTDDALRSTIEIEGQSWSIVIKPQLITVVNGHPAELFRFTVRREGKFAFSGSKIDGGRVIGMRMNRRHFGTGTLIAFPADEPRGWVFSCFSSCGSAFGMRNVIVTPDTSKVGSRETAPEYFQLEVETKDDLVVHRDGDDVELWGSYQEWGGGGTAASTYVPFRHTVQSDGLIRRKLLPADMTSWPDGVLRGNLPPSLPAVFTAGLREESPDLMRAALSMFPEETEVDWVSNLRSWLRYYGLPLDRIGLEKMIADVEIIVAAKQRLRRASSVKLEDPVVR